MGYFTNLPPSDQIGSELKRLDAEATRAADLATVGISCMVSPALVALLNQWVLAEHLPLSSSIGASVVGSVILSSAGLWWRHSMKERERTHLDHTPGYFDAGLN
jgi:hypothetical protein